MGYVYLLESSDNDNTVYKIGVTKRSSTQKRITELQTGNNNEIREVKKYESEYANKIETALHNHFSYKKIKNEWFNLDLNDVVNFLEICEKFENGFIALQNNVFMPKI